jgi:hypothetical protein
MIEKNPAVSAAAPEPQAEEGYERTHSDLRLAPAEPDESQDMSDPLNHYDLRIVPVEPEKMSDRIL